MDSELNWIQEWYRAQCDGNWEHSYGVKIETLDNPGWAVTVDLKGTALEYLSMDTVSMNHAPDDWISLQKKDVQFVGHGDPGKLRPILAAFRHWALRGERA